jgi:hypothetical protein
MLALSGSLLMMMLVSILFSVQTPAGLQANISTKKVFAETLQPQSSLDAEKILNSIQEYIVRNDPDSAKKLYDELYALPEYRDIVLDAEVEGET